MLVTRNDGAVDREELAYPSPELIIKSVTRIEDIRHLSPERPDAGVVYTYGDRDWRRNLTNYTGESKTSVVARHSSTHSKAQWLKEMTYPLIISVQPSHRAWDTDTRRAIESMLVYKKSLIGFDVANFQNSTWEDNAALRTATDVRYVRDIVRAVLEYELFHLGAIGVDLHLLKSTGVVEVSQRSTRVQAVLGSKIVTRNVIARRQGTVVRGCELEDGKIVVTDVQNLPAEASVTDRPRLAARHARLVAEATTSDGTLNWSGQTPGARPGTWLSAAVGTPVSKDLWADDHDAPAVLLEFILGSETVAEPDAESEDTEVAEYADEPLADVDVVAEYRSTTLTGTRSPSGEIRLTGVTNLHRSLPLYMADDVEVAACHADLLSGAVERAGVLSWSGLSDPRRPEVWLAAGLAAQVPDLWTEA